MNGIELCERIAESWPDLPVIVITAFGTVEYAIAAIRAGAYDFIIKPFETRGPGGGAGARRRAPPAGGGGADAPQGGRGVHAASAS